MFDLYEESQPVVYKIIKNALGKHQLSHAYLFESNGDGQALDIAISFAKEILCPVNHQDKTKCVNCTQCVKIDKNEYSEFMLVEPDGMWIKKEQLDQLQKNYELKAIESKYRVYIINHANKMNASAANSILKFLEEPEPGIIAILIADNKYQLLDTIISRCQIISLKKNTNVFDSELNYVRSVISNPIIKAIEDEQLNEYIYSALKFIQYYEENKLTTLLYTNKMFHEIFCNRDLILFAFDIIILYYKDIINVKCQIGNCCFQNQENQTQKIASNNTLEQLIQKINIFMKKNKLVLFNVNINLLIDQLILELNKGESV